jgi:lipid II isoglutaminyl synthase (glutamine-hydrolysing)
MVKKVTLGHLYPKQMNVYGDMGNIITLKYRLEAYGYEVEYIAIDSLQHIKNNKVDILVGGGGQDSNQGIIQEDLLEFGAELKSQCDDGLVCLMICGMYQMFGRRFVLPDKTQIDGIGIIDAETKAGETRLIGNINIDSEFGQLVGFENHSGRTYLAAGVKPLGMVTKGAGNNGETGEEGVVVNNVFGSYLHGPALVKNPTFADELIKRALGRRGESTELPALDDYLEHQAARIASKRPR